jgi:hypothetical protein
MSSFEWERLRALCERRAVARWRTNGESDAAIEVRLLFAAGEPDRLVTPDELTEILAANPAIAASEAVQSTLAFSNNGRESIEHDNRHNGDPA